MLNSAEDILLCVQLMSVCGFRSDVVSSSQDSESSAVLCTQCTDEDTDEMSRSVTMSDLDSSDSIDRQCRLYSSALLKKQQKLSTPSPDVFIKVCVLMIVSVAAST